MRVRVMSGKGAPWGCVDRGRNEQPERAKCSCPALLLPQSLLASRSLPGSLPKPGLEGGRVPGPGPGRGGQPRGSSAPALLPASRAPLEEGDPGCRQGSPDLGMERGSETFSLWQLLKHPLLRECRSQLTPGLPATPPSSLIPSCSHLALNLGSGARR